MSRAGDDCAVSVRDHNLVSKLAKLVDVDACRPVILQERLNRVSKTGAVSLI